MGFWLKNAFAGQSGQATIETLFIFPIGILIVTAIIWSAASGWSVFWMEYELQDALICMSDNSPFICKNKYEVKMRDAASFLRISSLDLEKRSNELYGTVSFSFPFSGRQKFSLEKSIPWPLREY
jgi:hypothetical protein